MLADLRRAIPGEEFDYQTLMHALREFQRPRDKVTSLLRNGSIVRIKKGIYIFGKRFARGPYSREVLANMIYGPSYISLDSALQYHAFIPERVEAVTSVTCGRGRRFSTPVGLFLYKSIPMKAYSIGVDQVQANGGRSFLIAVAEKALADKLQDDRGAGVQSLKALHQYLVNDLRIDMEEVAALNPDLLSEIAKRYRSRKIKLLQRLVQKLAGKK